MPSLDWNRRWGGDLAQQLRKLRLRHYGDAVGRPCGLAGAALARHRSSGSARFRNLPRVVRDYVAPYVGPTRSASRSARAAGAGRSSCSRARELILVDLNPEFFDYLRERFPDARRRIRFYQTKGYELPAVADASVDFAFSFGTFVHIEPEGIDAYLGELRRVLRPGGVAVLQYADKTKCPRRGTPNFSDMTPARMEALAAAHGFRLRAHDTALLLHSSIAVLERAASNKLISRASAG